MDTQNTQNDEASATDEAVTKPLQQEIEALKIEATISRERAMRALADLENFKRREAEQKKQWSAMAVGSFLSAMSARIFELKKGMDLLEDPTYKAVVETFFSDAAKAGMQLIVPEAGVVIDPNRHEVLLAAEGKPGTVVAVLEPGIEYGGVVVMPAKISGASE
jgi:molecular chaperone GrpE